ncbi:hypothetical protein HAX54_037990 [Datura stramonium]|uniref:Uncharacterized protein n=1 Tax=Datura stramonium TaxID=4076 RepID=A0ABS8VN60_DATST|nr:hypothetical protein [Datura stramonium]
MTDHQEYDGPSQVICGGTSLRAEVRDVSEGAVTSLQAEVRELRSRAPIEDSNMSLLDVVIAAPSISLGLIDDLFEALGRDDEANLGDEGHDEEEANDDTEE